MGQKPLGVGGGIQGEGMNIKYFLLHLITSIIFWIVLITPMLIFIGVYGELLGAIIGWVMMTISFFVSYRFIWYNKIWNIKNSND